MNQHQPNKQNGTFILFTFNSTVIRIQHLLSQLMPHNFTLALVVYAHAPEIVTAGNWGGLWSPAKIIFFRPPSSATSLPQACTPHQKKHHIPSHQWLWKGLELSYHLRKGESECERFFVFSRQKNSLEHEFTPNSPYPSSKPARTTEGTPLYP